MKLKFFLASSLGSIGVLAILVFSQHPGADTRVATFAFGVVAFLALSGFIAHWLAPSAKAEIPEEVRIELVEKKEAVEQLRQLKSLLLAANDRLSRRLFENRVMLAIWSEQDKAQDTKEFLSHLLEALLPGVPFDYGCIIIRPLAAIGPEMLFAQVERNTTRTIDLPLDEYTQSIERTLWISDIDPKVKEFLLASGQESKSGKVLSLETTMGCLSTMSRPEEITVLTLALKQGDDFLGSLHLLTPGRIDKIGSSLQNFLTNVRAQVAVLLQIRALSHAMRVDPLTRLYNRGYMNDRMREELTRSSRTNRPFTFLLLDVDHFKQVNDTHGHQAGDEVLMSLAALLKRTCRASDAICRYGGEEIAIILVDTPLSGAKIFAENLRKAVEAEKFIIDQKEISVTVSMGLAEYPGSATKGEEVIAKADLALYQAKNAGRNTWRTA